MNDKKYAVYHREGYIGYITLNRPDKRNALNVAVWTAIGEAADEAAADAECRVVLLKGEGKSFCAGLDLSTENELFSSITSGVSASQKVMLQREIMYIQRIHTRLDRLPKPTISVIHSHCLGGGLELAVCTDIRLCSADAQFALPEAKLAIITDVGGLQRLTRIVGQGYAREISFRGHRFGPDKAKEIGLVNEVYPDHETLFAKALEMAEEIAGNPPLAVQGAKDVFIYDEDHDMEASLEYNAARSCMIMPSEDFNEALASYLEKRPGNFKGA